MNKKTIAALCLSVVTSLSVIPSVSVANEDLLVQDETGTDPRDFGAKFMPYYRTTELKNGVEVESLTAFGMIPFTKSFAMTYEIPVVNLDISGATASQSLSLDSYDETGLGDTNLRFMAPVGQALGMTWLAGTEVWLPTHSEDVLGVDQVRVAPLLVNVLDMDFLPMPGAFMAMMHFYEFDAFGDSDEADVSLYKGRYFFMIPLNEKYKVYSLTEMQPMYDFEEDHFSFWVGPEIGTGILGDGKLLYVKPGWGVDPDKEAGDREFTFEMGFRYFY